MSWEAAVRIVVAVLWSFAITLTFGIVIEAVGLTEQAALNRRIDGRSAQAYATFTARVPPAWTFADDGYRVDYIYDGRPLHATLRSIPDEYAIGDTVCLEVDADHPVDARL